MNPIPHLPLPRAGALAFGAPRQTHMHNGIDLPAPEGTAVVATLPGIVVYASDKYEAGFAGYGAHVVIRHDEQGAWTLYAHLSRVDVAPGQSVVEGETLGAVGRTSFTHADHEAMISGGSHLHFEASPTRYPQANTAPRFDPVAWLGGVASEGIHEAAPPFALPKPTARGHFLPRVPPLPRGSGSADDQQCPASWIGRTWRCTRPRGHLGEHDFGNRGNDG